MANFLVCVVFYSPDFIYTSVYCSSHFLTELSPYGRLMKELSEAGDKLVLINFSKYGSKDCEIVAPKVKELAKTRPNVVFLYVETENDKEATEKFKVSVFPTFVFVKKSEKIDAMIGTNIFELKLLIEKHILLD